MSIRSSSAWGAAEYASAGSPENVEIPEALFFDSARRCDLISSLVGISLYLVLAGGIGRPLLEASRQSRADAANLSSPYTAHFSANSSNESADGAVLLERLDLLAIRSTGCHHAFESGLVSASTTASICLSTWSLQSLRACRLSIA